MDAQGYPEESELQKIREWDAIKDAIGLIRYIRERWSFAQVGCFQYADGNLELHTAGWSGNESIIEALVDNPMFWTMYWQMSKRGGHYFFNDTGVGDGLKLPATLMEV